MSIIPATSIDCATNPDYPAAVPWQTFRVSAAGIIGGALGISVGIGDVLIATERVLSADHANIGAKWIIVPAEESASDNLLGVDLALSGDADIGGSLSVGEALTIGGFSIVKETATVTLATDSDTTSSGITPTGAILHAALRVSTQIAGLDSADHHIQLGVAGTVDKYIDKANGSAATTIAVNTKDHYQFDPTIGVEALELILTLTGGSDQIPTGGAVELEVIYIVNADLADV